MEIQFLFEGKKYAVGMEGYERNLIRLPDDRVLTAEGWLESYPPIPEGLKVVESEPEIPLACTVEG